MGDPEEKARRQRRRKRNIIAREMSRPKKTKKVHLNKKDKQKEKEFKYEESSEFD